MPDRLGCLNQDNKCLNGDTLIDKMTVFIYSEIWVKNLKHESLYSHAGVQNSCMRSGERHGGRSL